MQRTDPVLHRAHSATWYAWGRQDERRGQPGGVTLPDHDVDAMDFGRWAADEARQYHDESHPRSHLSSIQDQWKRYLELRETS